MEPTSSFPSTFSHSSASSILPTHLVSITSPSPSHLRSRSNPTHFETEIYFLSNAGLGVQYPRIPFVAWRTLYLLLGKALYDPSIRGEPVVACLLMAGWTHEILAKRVRELLEERGGLKERTQEETGNKLRHSIWRFRFKFQAIVKHSSVPRREEFLSVAGCRDLTGGNFNCFHNDWEDWLSLVRL